MRVKQLRGEGDSAVRLVYPSTIDEYREVMDALERPADTAADGGPGREALGTAAGTRPLLRGHHRRAA